MLIETPALFVRERMGVAIIVRDLRLPHQILTCMRLGCRDMNGLWQFPGGAIEPHESHVEAAQRELREETGIQRELIDIVPIAIGVGKTPAGEIFVTEFFKIDCLDTPRPVNLEPKKHSDWEWVTPADLCLRPIIPLAKRVLERLYAP